MKAFEIGARRTVVFYLHGLRGHGFAQKTALEHMVKNLGVSLISLELPGHGKDSFLEHCMVPEYRQLVSMITGEVRRLAGDAEQVILMGYSFGGALMTMAANDLQNESSFTPNVAGFIGISTAYDVAHNVAKWQLVLAEAIAPISRFLFRHAPQWSRYVTIRGMDVSLITPSAHLQKLILADELVYKGRIPLNTSAQVYKASLAAKKLVNTLPVPILLLQGRETGRLRSAGKRPSLSPLSGIGHRRPGSADPESPVPLRRGRSPDFAGSGSSFTRARERISPS